MHITPHNNKVLFFSGIHTDMLGKLDAPALQGASNPGKFTSMAGGASLNSASVARCLGVNCTIIGLIGDDQAGEMIKQTLVRRGINNRLTICQGKATGSYTSIIEPDGNLYIAIADLGLNEEMDADWLLEAHGDTLTGSDIWFLNSNLSSDALLSLSEKTLSQRPKILAAASISPSKSQKLAPSLANIDVLFTNIAEASAMLNILDGKPYDGPILNAGQCITRFQQLGISKGSLSQGAYALWVWDEDGQHQFKPAPLKIIVDVTGAGDALAGAFLSGLGQNKSMAELAPLAIGAAQMTISVLGPYNEKINQDELISRAIHVRSIT